MSVKRITEAPESNAGDDFHVLWAMKRSFELLNYEDSGLKLLTLEGIKPEEGIKLDPSGTEFLGVDIAEYYGEGSFKDAKKVIIAQLKYSTRKVSDNWTFYDLYSGKTKESYEGSIINRLAKSFKKFCDEYGNKQVLSKLSIKFISNRKFSTNQYDNLLKLKEELAYSKKLSASILQSKFPSQKEAILKIKKASELNFIDFSNFIRILDLGDCGVESSQKLEITIFRKLRGLGFGSNDPSNKLYRYILKAMLPDAVDSGQNKLEIDDLLDCLNTRLEMLFPVNQKLEYVEHFIKREQTDDLNKLIQENESGNPICIDGGAGMGKSTFAQFITKHASKDLEVIIFDCYGAGEYLNPSDQRHLPKEALVQISNEIAKKYGTPFLVNREQDSYLLLREFKKRIQDVCSILLKQGNSKLVLVIDAVDNSISAAESKGQVSFVKDLLNEIYPENFRLIVTTRTNRVNSLELPEGYIPFTLKPFSPKETEEHLLSYFPKSSSVEIAEFHKFSNGVPRVQFYAIDLKRQGIIEVINYLKPNGKTVADLIEDKIDEAAKRLGPKGKDTITTFFQTLISLPRPIPIKYVAEVSRLEENLIRDLSSDIWHGLKLDKNDFSFRDEDFEDYVRSKYKPEEQLKINIVESFSSRMKDEIYAASNIGIALYNAHHYQELIDLVEKDVSIAAVYDPIRKKEIFIERVKLALQVCNKLGEKLSIFKLLFIASDAVKADSALKDLLSNNKGLVYELGEGREEATLSSYPIKNKDYEVQNGYYYATLFARSEKNTQYAKTLLRQADHWVYRLSKKKKEDNSNEVYTDDSKTGISYTDISYGLEAHLRVNGLINAKKWLLKWKPKDIYSTVSSQAIQRLLLLPNDPLIKEIIENFKILPVGLQLTLINNLSNRKLADNHFDRIYNVLIRYLNRNQEGNSSVHSAILSFCEYFAKSKGDEVRYLLEKIIISLPSFISISFENRFSENASKIDNYFRKVSLINKLASEDPYTLESIIEGVFGESSKITESTNRETKKYKRFVTYALEIYNFRSTVFFNGLDADISAELNSICLKIKDDYSFRYDDNFRATENLLFFALRLVDVLFFVSHKKEALETLIQSFLFGNRNTISLRITIAEKLSKMEGFEQSLLLPLVHDAEVEIALLTLPANDKIDWLLRFSNIFLFLDPKLSKHYFELAIVSVNEVDLEAFDKINCLNSLSFLGNFRKEKELAFKFSEYLKFSQAALSGYDNFPMKEGIEIIANLDLNTALKVLCQWDHLMIFELSEHLDTVLKIALENDFVSPEFCGLLLSICRPFRSYDEELEILIIKRLTANKNIEQKNELIEYLLNDIEVNSQDHYFFSKLYSLLREDQSLEPKNQQHLERYFEFLGKPEKKENSGEPEYSGYQISTEFDDNLKALASSTDLSSTLSINTAVFNLKEQKKMGSAYPEISKYFEIIKENCPSNQYIDHLDALLEIDINLIGHRQFQDLIETRLKDWMDYPLMPKWAKENFTRTLRILFESYRNEWGLSIGYIKSLAEVFNIEDKELGKYVFQILPETIDEFNTANILHLIILVKNSLNNEENQSLTNWVINRWYNQIGAKQVVDLNRPEDTEESIALVIRYILGHPDKRVRWFGVHTLRRIVNSGNRSILAYLIKEQNSLTCSNFQNKEFTYFWMSAKLYLWICINRLSLDCPEIIAEYKDEIFKELNSDFLQHALILNHIKSTCKNLITSSDDFFLQSEKDLIENVLVSPFKPVKEERYSREQRKYSSVHRDWRFNFDSLDTMPYWFDSLSRVFNLTKYDVADLADNIISSKWGYTGDVLNDNHVKVGSHSEYSLISNRQGQLPIIEDLRLYYEYHSMFCAATLLLSKEPTLAVDLEDGWSGWNNWIERWTRSLNGFWLSEYRDPVPVGTILYLNSETGYDKKWKDEIPDRLFDQAVGIEGEILMTTFCVSGYYTNYLDKNYESVSISSAIVSSKTSKSLLRALQTSRGTYDYVIPTEGNDEILEGNGFVFRGWLKNTLIETSGEEKCDPLTNEISLTLCSFGKIVNDLYKISTDRKNKEFFWGEKRVATMTNWSTKNHNSFRGNENEGHKFDVDSSFLLDFLSKIKSSLLLECEIKRNLKDESYKFDDSEPRINKAKLYLIHADGTIETI